MKLYNPRYYYSVWPTPNWAVCIENILELVLGSLEKLLGAFWRHQDWFSKLIKKPYMVIQLINGPGRVSQWAFGKVEKPLIQWGLRKCSSINPKRKTTLCFLWFLRSRNTKPHPRLIIFLFDKPTGKVGLIHTSIPRKKFK